MGLVIFLKTIYLFNFYLTIVFDSAGFRDITPCLSEIFIFLRSSMHFFPASVTFLRSGQKTGTIHTQNSMAHVKPCWNVHPGRWLWAEQALMATRPPACRAPVAPCSVHSQRQPNCPASCWAPPGLNCACSYWLTVPLTCRSGLMGDPGPARTYSESQSLVLCLLMLYKWL